MATKTNTPEYLLPLLNGPKTRSELGISRYELLCLEDGLLVENGSTKLYDGDGRATRGHPAKTYKATPKLRKRLLRMAAKMDGNMPDELKAQLDGSVDGHK